ncbi:VDP/USO1/YBL047C family vesicular transport factor [Cryptosporidium ryanae]|uniref:VDP/USO1/YBL047C family vesicular transport factor n=1 Tax=Cryptosporidium ryanae TaxID=515981 RepID=UPI003519F594|nr:VDP/USO1/YBL047C family vesicular transport factor [Cryptosporidium ryanae]
MAFSLLKKVNEKVLSSVSLLDASLDVDYSIANIRNSITSGNAEKIESGIKSLLNFSEENANALIIQREWVEVVFQVIKWMGASINASIFDKILQLIIKMTQNEVNTEYSGVTCCTQFVGLSINSNTEASTQEKENYKMIEEIVEVSKGGTLLIEALKNLNYDDTDLYIKYDIVKILCIIQRSELGRYKLDEMILSQGDTIGILLELLSDGLKNHSSYLQNTLELLMLLTKKNSEVQKIITYNGSVQEIINIMSEEFDIMIKNANYNNKVEFSSSDKIFDSFMGIVDLKSYENSNIIIIEMSLEIVYHVLKSNNCLNYIIESQTNEKNKLITILEKLLGYYTLLMEHNSFKLDWNRFNAGENEIEKMEDKKDRLILYSMFIKILDILILYCGMLKKQDDRSLERIQEIILYTIMNIDYVKYNIIDKIKELTRVFQNSNINTMGNLLWLLAELSSGVTPSIWYGFHKIITDYTPTIKYIIENKSSDNEQHINQIEELRIKYLSQMEMSILYWLDNMIISKNDISDIIKITNRDDWIFNSFLNSTNLTSKIILSSMTSSGNDLIRSDLFLNYISLCFWFPVIEFDRLNKSSFFTKFENQFMVFNEKLNEKYDDKDEQKVYLSFKYHYRVFRTLQGLQVMTLNYEDSPNFFIGSFGNPKTIKDLTAYIWNPGSVDENQRSRSHCDLSDEFPKQVLNNVLQVTKYMTDDIYSALEKIDASVENENNSKIIDFLNSYSIKQPKYETDCDMKYSYNSLTTLVQCLILLIVLNTKGDSDVELPENLLKELKKLNEKIKGVTISKNKYNNFCLVTDLVNIILYSAGIIKNSNLICQTMKRLGTNVYNNEMIFSKKTYSCIMHSLNKLNNSMFYQRDSSFGKYNNTINTESINNRNGSKININIDDNDFSCLDNLVQGEERVALEEGVDSCCINCIYLNEKIYKERVYFRNLIRKKQEEIDVLVKAYMESRDIISGKRDMFANKSTNNRSYGEKGSDFMILIEMIGILNRKFPQVRRFIENNFALSSKTKSEILNLSDLQGDEFKTLECEYVNDFSQEALNIGIETNYHENDDIIGVECESETGNADKYGANNLHSNEYQNNISNNEIELNTVII